MLIDIPKSTDTPKNKTAVITIYDSYKSYTGRSELKFPFEINKYYATDIKTQFSMKIVILVHWATAIRLSNFWADRCEFDN